ncbi:lytic murein transglycosylase B [Leminorella grimontii]|uniref:lytic murein transglycosylase B n=1 Tax=Leminorella grimontii TaxID=82981 RepID=UPI00207E4FE2|nr:lytic murein transglycosylase B [Leminorella grimontii]GKX59588.1 murein hydrolase B [Leminorella grimontii]
MRYLTLFLPLFLLLTACSSKPDLSAKSELESSTSGGFKLDPEHSVHPLTGDFSGNPNAERFIDNMVNTHGFDRQQLHDVLAQTKRLDYVLNLMEQQAPTPKTTPQTPSVPVPNGAWIRYHNKFITTDNVQKGVEFWNQYEDALKRAEKTYGVPPEIIVGIIGVETRWGRVMGKTRIIDALATLSFDYPRRAAYFTKELEIYLLMARAEGRDPLSLQGSYAGAMGYGQFMPSSFKDYAVDFNGDGHVNLWDPVDAIGSVANYFKAHGWQPGEKVAIVAQGDAPMLKHGFNTRYTATALAAAKLRPTAPLGNYKETSLLRLDMGKSFQYWYGLPNFYAITRYNHSTHYAMAVWQLGQEVSVSRRMK